MDNPKDIEDEWHARWAELGRMRQAEYGALGFYLCQCGAVEASLHFFIRALLGIDEQLERLLVGEPRVVDLVDLIRKAVKLKEMDEHRRAVLDRILNLVVENNKIRQVVAHKAGAPTREGGKLVFHNAPSAKSKTAIYVYACTADQLVNQVLLLHEITLQLGLMMDSRLPTDKYPRLSKRSLHRLDVLSAKPRPEIPIPTPDATIRRPKTPSQPFPPDQ